QNRICDALFDALGQSLGVGDKQIVADQLNLAAQRTGHELPAVPIVLGHTVLDGDDWILFHPLGPELYHLLGGPLTLVGFLENVLAAFFVIELTGSWIEREPDLSTRFVASFGDGFEHDI